MVSDKAANVKQLIYSVNILAYYSHFLTILCIKYAIDNNDANNLIYWVTFSQQVETTY